MKASRNKRKKWRNSEHTDKIRYLDHFAMIAVITISHCAQSSDKDFNKLTFSNKSDTYIRKLT